MQHATAGVLTTPDETLIERARGGDAPAREELFRRHFGVAYRVAHRLLGHDQDALDAVQDGFLKALRRLDDFDGRSGFRTWLLRVVTNAALDLGRRRRRRPAVSLDDNPTDLAIADGEDPSKGLQGEDLRQILNTAMARLSPRIRATFVLFAEAGLSYKEIAEAQNVPIGTVMSRLNFARRKLQSYLGDADVFAS
jgi:RNA polymerase sigma-70 factor (ECF subfamily)